MRRAPRTQSAFTLLEIMLAVTILGLVMTAVYSTWSAGINGWKRTSNVSDSFQRERIVMGTLADLTKSLVFAANKDKIYGVVGTHDEQDGDEISFVTASDLLLPKVEASVAGLRRVTIRLVKDERGRTALGIANSPALLPDDASDPWFHVLSADVCGFAVRYRNGRTAEWQDEWDDVEIPPSAIEFTVGFGKNDGRTPAIVVTRGVELPTAEYALLQLGQTLGKNNTTNTVGSREITLTPGQTPDAGGDSE